MSEEAARTRSPKLPWGWRHEPRRIRRARPPATAADAGENVYKPGPGLTGAPDMSPGRVTGPYIRAGDFISVTSLEITFTWGASCTRPACGSMRTGDAPWPPPQPRRGASPAAVRRPLAPAEVTLSSPLRRALVHTTLMESRRRRHFPSGFPHVHFESVPCAHGQADPPRDDGSGASTWLPVAGDPRHIFSVELCDASAEPHAPRTRRVCPVYSSAPPSLTGLNGEVLPHSAKSTPKRLFVFYFDTIVVRVSDFIFSTYLLLGCKSPTITYVDFMSRERPKSTRYRPLWWWLSLWSSSFRWSLLYGFPSDDGCE